MVYKSLASVIKERRKAKKKTDAEELATNTDSEDAPEIDQSKAKETTVNNGEIPKHKYIDFDDDSEEDDVKKTGRQKAYTDKGVDEAVEIEEASNRAPNRQKKNQSSAMHRVRELMKMKKAGKRVTQAEWNKAKAAAEAEQKHKEQPPVSVKKIPKQPKPVDDTGYEKINDRAKLRIARSAHNMMVNHPVWRRHASDISGHITDLINKGKMPHDLIHKAAGGEEKHIKAVIDHAHDSWKKKNEKPGISLASIRIKK